MKTNAFNAMPPNAPVRREREYKPRVRPPLAPGESYLIPPPPNAATPREYDWRRGILSMSDLADPMRKSL